MAILFGIGGSDYYSQDFMRSLAPFTSGTLSFIVTSEVELTKLSSNIESKFGPDQIVTGSVQATVRSSNPDWPSRYLQLSNQNFPKQSKKVTRKSTQIKKEVFGASLVGFGKIAAGQRFSDYIKSSQNTDGQLVEFCEDQKCIYKMDKLEQWINKYGSGFESKLKLVNRYVNKSIDYKSDTAMHGRLDKWSLPSETLQRGAGDCEDYAILKMGILSKLGVPNKAMSVIVLKDTDRQLYHAVLAVRTNVGTFILDNARNKVMKDSQISSYKPLYSVGAAGNHVFGYKRSARTQVASIVNFSNISPGAAFTEDLGTIDAVFTQQ
tara:strand:- start:1212 stop:2177 length:966 start_codon:yes stop_codon:yes gene_type:complete